MMQINLDRVDYINISANSRKCMELLPSQKAGVVQPVVVGDMKGNVQSFALKRGDISQVFKAPLGKSITRVSLGGEIGKLQDKIFLTIGNEVRGFTKKGKQFLTFSTSITDSIRSMLVKGNELYVAGEYTYNKYIDLKEFDYYLSTDGIIDIALVDPTLTSSYAVLACQDRMLRVLNRSEVLYEIELTAIPKTLALYGNEEGSDIVYGTSDGSLGLVSITDNERPTHGWTYSGTNSKGSINCIDFYDILGDGVLDLICGRDDGHVEVFAFNDMAVPESRINHILHESINAIRGGRVNNAGFDELVVTTYQGWVLGLTTEKRDKVLSSTDPGTIVSEEEQKKVSQLKAELEELQAKLLKERERYQKFVGSDSGHSVMPRFEVQDSFRLSREDASYVLSIEVQSSIDTVLIQSDVPVDILDSENNSSVVSFSEVNPSEGNCLLVTYRCQANTSRLEARLRTIEGQYGTLRVYITPRMQPKTAQLREYNIKPLSLHQRAHFGDSSKPMNTLTMTGTFSMAEMHSWIKFCLPDVPEKPPAEDECTLYFTSVFLDTDLECTYKKGEAVFRSDSISTISIIKDVLSREATKRKMALNVSAEVDDRSVPNVLRLIHPRLEKQILLAKKVQLIEPLRELVMQENASASTDDSGDTGQMGAMSFLAPEYREILEHAEDLQKQAKQQPAHLERLYGMITDLFIDKFKFKGMNVKGKVSQLVDILDSYNLDTLLHFFETANIQ